ncbi:MAG: alpha/beta hydrolase [Anaerolineales bacterium]
MTTGMAEINGTQLYYEVKGNGHPLLLVHAGVADSRMWETQFEAFSKEFKVIRFDLRGFGRSNMPSGSFSNREDIKALLDFLGIESVYLLGISFGGLIALDFTLAHPEYVNALVLGAPSVSGASPSERVRQFWDEEDAALEKDDLEGATEINLRLWVDGPHRESNQVSADVRELVREMQLNIFRKEIPDDVEEIDLEPPAIERLGEVEVPVQIMVGDLDLEEKLGLVDKLTEEISDCRKVVIPGVAHMLNMEKPEVFNRSVLAFLSNV